jgi:hypothetical protein
MNDWDRDNLEFIMNSSEDEFQEWMKQATQDDINYALELVAQGREELYRKKVLYKGLQEWEHYEEVKDFTEAQKVLDKFKLKK